MASDFQAILEVEQAAADSKTNPRILESLKLVITPVVRMMFLLFEADGFRPSSRGGIEWMSGMLRCLPDSKLIEDIHGILRLQGKAQKNKRQTVHQMMELMISSNALEGRAIGHFPKVDRDTFLSDFKRTSDKRRKRPGGL